MLDSRYDAIYQPMWSKDCELYAHFSRKNPVVRHLIDEGFATWRQFEEDAPFPCDVAHLYEPRLISDRHSEVRILRMPEITPERVRLFGWLDSAFPLTESEHPPKVEGVAGPASSVLFDQNFGSGMYRSDHPSSKTVRLWESRKAVLEGAENMVNAVGGTLVVRAHPYSSDREILDLEAFWGHKMERSNGRPFEVDLLLGRRAVPQKIFTIASSAAFLVPVLVKDSGGEGYELHFFFPYYVGINPEQAAGMKAFLNVLERLQNIERVKVVLHDTLGA